MKIKVTMVIVLVVGLICGCTNDIQETQDIQTTEINETEVIINEVEGSSTDTSNEESVESMAYEENGVKTTESMEDLFEYTITAKMTFFNYSQNEIDPIGDYLYKEDYISGGEGAVDDFYMWDGKAENFFEIILNDLQDTQGAFVYKEVDTSIIRHDTFRTYEFEYIILPSGYKDNGRVFKYEGMMDIALMERRDTIINHIKIEAFLFVTSPEEGIVVHVGDRPQWKNLSEDEIRILVGDTVEWRNMENAKNPRYLISDDGLWDEPIRINYAKTHEYTFNEKGTYTFCLKYNEINSRQKIVVV